MTQLGAIQCCKGCVPPERHEGCHSTCEKYQKEKKAHDEYKEKVREGKAEHYAGISEQVLNHTTRRGHKVKKGQI